MSTKAAFIQLAMALTGTDTKPHFDRTAFRINGKIYATLHPTEPTANVKLTLQDQYVYSQTDPAIYPVPNGWAKMGYTTVEFTKLKTPLLTEVLTKAYEHVREKKKKAKLHSPDR